MLAAGFRLGPYTILAPLGAGGMGEVYRARDPRLGREVAVKVLPEGVSGDADRLRRFEQEARAASALNHPNILTVFDTGSQDGTVYLVTELLEGETLRERLSGGALPVRKAVEIAVQIARGLAAAHEKGIVHRDLKPENLFLTRDGRVKILDFGLARLQPSNIAEAPTILTGTEPGVVLGTVGYMAPEQVRGQSADHRADVFALGAVLYEMLAGRRAFQKDSAAETMTAILREEPPDLAESGRVIPGGVERVVRHCLEKDPQHRFQSASDFAFGLESLSALSAAALPPATTGRRRSLLRIAAVAGLLLAAAILAGVLAQRHWGQREPPRFQRLTFRRGNVLAARFAPDGQTIVHSATWDGEPIQIFTTRTDSPEARSLGLPSALLQSISPGGEMLIDLIRRENNIRVGSTLAQVPLAGGAPRPILEARSVWADWAPDGKSFGMLLHLDDEARIEYPRGKVLWRSVSNAWDLQVAPAGDALAFCEARGGTLSFVVLDRAGKVVTRSDGWGLPQGIAHTRSPAGCVGWSPDGGEVWFAAARPGGESGLYALTRGGEVRPLLHAPGTLALLDVGRDGRVLLAQFNPRRSIVVRAPGETAERDLSWFEDSEPADLSADGRWILFSDRGRRGGEQMSVYLRGTDGSPAVRLGDGWAQALSPDGRWALAATEADRLVLLPTGAGEPRALPPMTLDVGTVKWLSGRQILLDGAEPGKGEGLYILDIGAKEVRPLIREEGIRFYLPSPDGSRVAVWGRGGLKLHPIGGGEPSTVPTTELAGDYPIRWRADGRAVYIGRRGDGGRYWIDVVELATGKRSPWKELRPADPVTAVIRFPVVTPDGEAYAYSVSDSQSTLYLVEGLR